MRARVFTSITVQSTASSQSGQRSYATSAFTSVDRCLKVAMLTYSTRARGGVAHALKLAERLKRRGIDVTLYSLARSDDEAAARGYFRPVDVPFQVFKYEWHPDVMVRLERMVHAYAVGLPTDADVYHSQDCVGSTALALIKESGKNLSARVQDRASCGRFRGAEPLRVREARGGARRPQVRRVRILEAHAGGGTWLRLRRDIQRP